MSTTTTYAISPRRRVILYGCWAVMALFLLAHGVAFREPMFFIVAGLLTAIILPIFILAERAARLIVSAEGVELRQLGATLKTPWSNVAAIRRTHGSEGFVLHEAMAGRGPERVADTAQVMMYGASLYDRDRRSLLLEQRFIPIEAFAYWLTHGDLGRVIEAHAPGLLAAGERDIQRAAASGQGLSTSRKVLIALIIAASAGAGLGIALLPPRQEAIAIRVIEAPMALLIFVMSINNAIAAFGRLRAARYGSALLWGSVAVVQFLASVALLGHVVTPGFGQGQAP